MDGMESKQQVRIGDVVKSLDFVGVNDCYYIGLVTAIHSNDGTFRADTIKRVWMGELDNRFPSATFVAALPGNHFFDDMAEEKSRAQRVQVLA
jgi:hypothetical protein